MADKKLLNQAALDGTYDGDALELKSNILSTTLIGGLTATKSADQNVWLNGYLTYTVTINNEADEDFETPVLTDTLDITQIALVEDSVEIDGVPTAYTYDDLTGLLTVSVPTVDAGTSVAVTFKVERI